jgi:predicted amidohydrolase
MGTNDRLTVASIQFELRGEPSVKAFLDHMDEQVTHAADARADVVVFPELASTGLLGSITDHPVTSQSITRDYWEVLAPMAGAIEIGVRDLALRHGLAVLGGSHNRIHDDGSLRNTAFLAHPDGRVEYQDKIHLTPQEHELGLRGGDDLLVSRLGPFTVGVLICADIQFPELSRHLVSQGVDLILCPSLTWNSRGVHRVRTGCQARAIENQLFVVMSPLVGSDGLPGDAPMYAKGQALATVPVDRTFGLNDGLLGQSDTEGETMLLVELDRGLLMASRENPEAPGLRLQRPDVYRRLQAGEGVRP